MWRVNRRYRLQKCTHFDFEHSFNSSAVLQYKHVYTGLYSVGELASMEALGFCPGSKYCNWSL